MLHSNRNLEISANMHNEGPKVYYPHALRLPAFVCKRDPTLEYQSIDHLGQLTTKKVNWPPKLRWSVDFYLGGQLTHLFQWSVYLVNWPPCVIRHKFIHESYDIRTPSFSDIGSPTFGLLVFLILGRTFGLLDTAFLNLLPVCWCAVVFFGRCQLTDHLGQLTTTEI